MSDLSSDNVSFNTSRQYLTKNKACEKNQETDAPQNVETQKMRYGQKMIIAGFGIAIFGIILYCMAAFSGGFSQSEPVFIKESLSVTAVGTLIWLIGAVKYLNAAIESNTPDQDLL